jgi:peptidoglycan-N-acetylglucosamine deacetylase
VIPRALVATTVAVMGAVAYRLLASSTSQVLGRFPFRGETDEKVVALTFDDGPNEPFTSQIAGYLASEHVHATFFQVGRCVERFPGSPAALVRQGHVVGNHSYSHRLSRCMRPAAQRAETLRTQQILTSVLGRTPALYRPPWLLRTPSLLRLLRREGLRAVSGTFCHPGEIFQPAPERIARQVLRKTRPGSIMIFHDGFDSRGGFRGHTAAAVELAVDALRQKGFRFVTVDELLGVPAYT